MTFVGLLLASATALAATTGNVTGYVQGPDGAPLRGVTVTVTGPVLPGKRTATTDDRGFYRITQLPPGDGYQVRFERDGLKPTIRSGLVINIDATIKLPTVKMQSMQAAEAIEVLTEAPLVEQGSTSIGRTLSNEFLTTVPTGRTTVQVLALAPGASADQLGVTFRGATSPENHFVIDGLNTTGIVAGLSTSALPPEFVQEVQVKTGGYEPEYGRATGGQAIVITKSGGNEFHGDVFAYVTPIYGRAASLVNGEDNPATSHEEASLIRNDNNRLFAQVGFDLGGYIVKDRLWFFVGYAPSYTHRVIGHEYRQLSTMTEDERESLDPDLTDAAVYDARNTLNHFYLANLTFNVNENHSLRVSASGNPTFIKGAIFQPFGAPGTYMGEQRGGAQDYNLTYNGKFWGGKANLDAIVGYHVESGYTLPFEGTYNSLTGNSAFEGETIDGTLPNIVHNQSNYVTPGFDCGGTPCTAYGYFTGGLGAIVRTEANRFVVKPILSIFLNNLIGTHVFKLGGDLEINHLVNRRAFTGGAVISETNSRYLEQWYSNYSVPITWKGVDNNESYFNADTKTINTSAFIQDNWNILQNLSLSLGVRWERQQLQDIFGVSRIDIADNISPRLGVIFDWTNQGKSKLFANYGRYYESIPSDINDRALSAEGFNFYFYRKADYPDYAPAGNDLNEDLDGDGVVDALFFLLGGELTPVQKGLKGQYSDQVILGYEHEVADNLSVGLTGIYASLGNVIEDISPDNGNTYYISNPGADNTSYLIAPTDPNTGLPTGEESIEVDSDGDGVADVYRRCLASTDPLTGAPITYCFPKASRHYRGLEFTFTKRFSSNWQAQASYTWSQTYGNYPGLFSETNGQTDPNITSQFDLPSLLSNREGYLDQDRRHNIKVAGAYSFNFGTSLGLTANIQSGSPLTYLGAHAVYGTSEAFVIPRSLYPDDEAENAAAFGVEAINGRLPWQTQLDLNARHTFKLGESRSLMVGVQVNNVLNATSALRADQDWTFDYVNPAVGGSRLAQVQCYDDDTGAPVARCDRNPNFANPSAYQAPFNVRFEAKFSF